MIGIDGWELLGQVFSFDLDTPQCRLTEEGEFAILKHPLLKSLQSKSWITPYYTIETSATSDKDVASVKRHIAEVLQKNKYIRKI